VKRRFDSTIENLQERVGVCTRDKDCKAITHWGDCKSMPSTPTLEQLLREVDALFTKPQISINFTYNYSLGRFPKGWCFTVTNNWYRWSDRGLEHQFRVLATPQAAVQAFLDYVKAHNIDVADLMGDVQDRRI
jgi:hypothetical protein